MNTPLPASVPAKRRNWSRLLVNVLVALVVIAVAGATFVFSYDGVHAIALLGGVSARLARDYPGLFDAVLVIACVAAVVLRDGRWWARAWAWVGVQSWGRGVSRWQHSTLPGKRGVVPWRYSPLRCRAAMIRRGHSWATDCQTSSPLKMASPGGNTGRDGMAGRPSW